jgi:hypothetical protein
VGKIPKLPPWANTILITILMGIASYFLQGVDKNNREDHKEFRETDSNIRERLSAVETDTHILRQEMDKK